MVTLTLAPLSAGLVFHLVGTNVVAFAIAGWTLISTIFEYLLIKMIYNEYPQLSCKRERNGSGNVSDGGRCNVFGKLKEVFQSWVLYMKYPTRNAGFGFAFLWLTVLGFDNITYGFCLKQCVTEFALSILVGACAMVGVVGSIAFPFIRRKVGLAKTGLIGFICLLGALCLCVTSIWIEGSPFDPYYFR